MAPDVVAATFADLSSEEADALTGDDLSSVFPLSSPEITSATSYTFDNRQLLPSLSTLRTITPIEELQFDHSASLESGSMALGHDEIAAATVVIRRKWIEDKDTMMGRLLTDITKPDIGGIYQWEALINGDDVILDDYLPENISNSFQHKKKIIESFADWTVAFTSFRKAVLYVFNHRGPELDAHFEHISKLCRDSYSIKLILAYEKDVRHHVTKIPNLSLFADFSFLMSKHFMSVQPTITGKKTKKQKQICINYNSRFKRCTQKMCPRLHICSICFNSTQVQMTHPAIFCYNFRKKDRQEHLSRLASSTIRLSRSSRQRASS